MAKKKPAKKKRQMRPAELSGRARARLWQYGHQAGRQERFAPGQPKDPPPLLMRDLRSEAGRHAYDLGVKAGRLAVKPKAPAGPPPDEPATPRPTPPTPEEEHERHKRVGEGLVESLNFMRFFQNATEGQNQNGNRNQRRRRRQ